MALTSEVKFDKKPNKFYFRLNPLGFVEVDCPSERRYLLPDYMYTALKQQFQGEDSKKYFKATYQQDL